ncbi:MAG: DUF4012 domain-containing protein [Actinomycetota bacterium]
MIETTEVRSRVQQRKKRRIGRRALLWIGGPLALIFVVVLVAGLMEALAARGDLSQARAILSSAEHTAADQPLDQTAASLDRAYKLTLSAQGHTAGLPLRILARIPFFGRTPRTVRAIASAAVLATDAGRIAIAGMRGFAPDGGKIQFHLTGGNLQPADWARARVALAAASTKLAEASHVLSDTPNTWMPGSIESVRAKLLSDIDRVNRTLSNGAAAADLVPRMLGAYGPRTYLLILQNLAESRGTGGLIGGFALINTNHGKITLGNVAPNFDLKQPATPLQAPQWYVDHYGGFGSLQKYAWQNVNAEPDFRVTGSLIAQLFQKTAGTSIDGVITLDPLGVSKMLGVTGPLQGPRGVTLQSDTFPKLFMSDAYAMFPGNGYARKLFFVDLAKLIFKRFIAVHNDKAASAALAQAASGRHLFAWSRYPIEEQALGAMGADGAFDKPARSYLGITIQNGGSNKLDYYLRRSVAVSVKEQSNGSADIEMRMSIRNTAPATGLDPEVLGPNPSGPVLKPGENRLYISYYVPATVYQFDASVDGQKIDLQSDQSQSSLVLSHFLFMGVGQTREIVFRWHQDGAFGGSANERPIDFAVAQQQLIVPQDLTVSITAAKGYRASGVDAAETAPNEVTWKSNSGGVFKVRGVISRPLWRRFLDLFG